MISIYSLTFVILLGLKLSIKPSISWFVVMLPIIVQLVIMFSGIVFVTWLKIIK